MKKLLSTTAVAAFIAASQPASAGSLFGNPAAGVVGLAVGMIAGEAMFCAAHPEACQGHRPVRMSPHRPEPRRAVASKPRPQAEPAPVTQVAEPTAPPTPPSVDSPPSIAVGEKPAVTPPAVPAGAPTSVPAAPIAEVAGTVANSIAAPTPTAATSPMPTEVSVPLRQTQGGSWMVSATVNDTVAVPFVVDSGADEVSLPMDVIHRLHATGDLTITDVRGTEVFGMADGHQARALVFLIKSLRVGPVIVRNIRASSAPTDAPALLGQSFFRLLSSWRIDNLHHVLDMSVN